MPVFKYIDLCERISRNPCTWVIYYLLLIYIIMKILILNYTTFFDIQLAREDKLVFLFYAPEHIKTKSEEYKCRCFNSRYIV